MLKELNIVDAYAIEENHGIARLYRFSTRQWLVLPAFDGYSVLDYHAASGRMLLLSPWVEKKGTLKAHLVMCKADGKVLFATDDYLVSNARIAGDGQAILVETVHKPLIWIRMDAPTARVNTGMEVALNACLRDESGCWLCPANNRKGLLYRFTERTGKCEQRVLPGVDKVVQILTNDDKDWLVLDSRGQLRKFQNEKQVWSIALPPEKAKARPGAGSLFWTDDAQRILYNYVDEDGSDPQLHVLVIQESDGSIMQTLDFSNAQAQGAFVGSYGAGKMITAGKQVVDWSNQTISAADF